LNLANNPLRAKSVYQQYVYCTQIEDSLSVFNSENRERNLIFHTGKYDTKSRYRFYMGFGFLFTKSPPWQMRQMWGRCSRICKDVGLLKSQTAPGHPPSFSSGSTVTYSSV
jgi:hypothetical protein